MSRPSPHQSQTQPWHAANYKPPPPFSLQEDKHRFRTDPAKYKTEICRNWEQTGSCTYRGCTFAHGAEDLRPPPKTPPMGPQVISTNPVVLRTFPLLEAITNEIGEFREAYTVQQESNRVLENTLKKERLERMEEEQTIEKLTTTVPQLAMCIQEKEKVLLNLRIALQ